MNKIIDDPEIKVILVGEAGTGKTSLINVAMGMKFIEGVEASSSSASFVSKKCKIGDNSYTLNLWDTIGQEKYRSLTKIFIKDSKIVIFVYDITRMESFQALDYWYTTIKEVLGDTAVLGIAGNKHDLFTKEQVNEEIAKKFAEERSIEFRLTSAKNQTSFNTLLDDLLKKYILKTGGVIESGGEGKKLEDKKNQNGKFGGKCC